MQQLSFRDKLRYAFDNTMAKGPTSLILWLGLLTLLVILIMACIMTVFNIGPRDGDALPMEEGLWMNLMHTLDAGNVAGAEGWTFRVIMLMVTVGGIFIFSTLIGIISNGINGRLEELRKGHSFVIEKNHTLILGWNSKIFTVLSELSVANANQKNPRIVVLAQKDKVEMEEEIRRQVPNLRNTKVICRSGNPCDLTDLHIANPYDSRSVIILSGEGDSADSETIKVILALTNNPNRRKAPYHIVAEINDRTNFDVAKMVAGDELEAVLSDDLVARIMVQTCRQSGLSGVYVELLDFDGVEIYFSEEKSLAGKTFREAMMAYETSCIIGYADSTGKVTINPPMDYKLKNGEKVIAISEDDDTVKVSGKAPSVSEDAIRDARPAPPGIEKTLMLGWNKRALSIIRELNSYVPAGSQMLVVSQVQVPDEVQDEIEANLGNLQISFEQLDTASRPVLDSLRVQEYDHILLLCYDDRDLQQADSLTLITLLHLRDIAEKLNVDLSIVSEMYDIRNRELAEVTKADDFIVSDKLISLVLSQVSENKHLMRVFDELFTAEGSEIYLKPVEQFAVTGSPVNFYTVAESAARKGMVAIGYRVAAMAHDHKNAYGVVVNPDKSKTVTFTSGDKIIVISES